MIAYILWLVGGPPSSDVVMVAVVSGIVAVIVAWIGRPTREQQRRARRIEENTEKTGNGWTEHLEAKLESIEASLAARITANQAASLSIMGRLGALEEKLTSHTRRKDDIKHDSNPGATQPSLPWPGIQEK